MQAVNPSSRVSRSAKAASEAAAILRTLDGKSIARVITVLAMAQARHRGMNLEKVATFRRLPSYRSMFG
jgi:hypothetical protein